MNKQRVGVYTMIPVALVATFFSGMIAGAFLPFGQQSTPAQCEGVNSRAALDNACAALDSACAALDKSVLAFDRSVDEFGQRLRAMEKGPFVSGLVQPTDESVDEKPSKDTLTPVLTSSGEEKGKVRHRTAADNLAATHAFSKVFEGETERAKRRRRSRAR